MKVDKEDWSKTGTTVAASGKVTPTAAARGGYEVKMIGIEKDEIKINPRNNQTKTPGLFSAGDVTDIKEKQIVIAAGEGAKAALSINNYIKNIK